MRDADGKAVRMIGAMQDITARKITENSLLEAEDRYRRLVDLSPEPIFVHQDLKYVYVVDGDNKVVRHVVKLGSIQDGLQVITEGLQPGDRVIVKGLQRVQQGAVVSPTLEPMPLPRAGTTCATRQSRSRSPMARCHPTSRAGWTMASSPGGRWVRSPRCPPPPSTCAAPSATSSVAGSARR